MSEGIREEEVSQRLVEGFAKRKVGKTRREVIYWAVEGAGEFDMCYVARGVEFGEGSVGVDNKFLWFVEAESFWIVAV